MTDAGLPLKLKSFARVYSPLAVILICRFSELLSADMLWNASAQWLPLSNWGSSTTCSSPVVLLYV